MFVSALRRRFCLLASLALLISLIIGASLSPATASAQGEPSPTPTPTHGAQGSPPSATSTPQPHSKNPSGTSTTQATSVTVNVPSTVQWQDTGLAVNTSDQITVTASGSWASDAGFGLTGPDGYATLWPDNFLNLRDLTIPGSTPTPHYGALIGYIGSAPPAAGSYTTPDILPEAEKVFVVGSSYDKPAPFTGELWLNMNDDAYTGNTSDNFGPGVSATVTVTPPERGRLVVILQGIGSALTLDQVSSGSLPYFSRQDGLLTFLRNDSNWSQAQYLVYSYAGAYADGTPRPYSCEDTYLSKIAGYVMLLHQQITGYLHQHPNTDVYLIGHSLGGLVAFGELANLETKNWSQQDWNGGALKGVISLDAPLGGVSPRLVLSAAAVYDQTCSGIAKPTPLILKTLLDFAKIFGSAPYTQPQGANASVMEVLYPTFSSELISNQQIALDASSHGIRILSVGNVNDVIFDPTKCGVILGAKPITTTQWVADTPASGVYGRAIEVGLTGAACVVGSPASQLLDHLLVIYYHPVEEGVLNFLNGQNPDPLSPANLGQ